MSTFYLGEVVLNVNNLEMLRDFYERIIGLPVLRAEKGRVIFGFEGEALLALVQLENPQTKVKRAGLYHMALLLPTRADLAQKLRFLLSENIALEGGADHGYSEALYLSDPEGNGIEIYWDKPKSNWPPNIDGKIRGVTEPLDVTGVLAETDRDESLLPNGTTIGHVHLSVKDLDKTELFYRDVLGFDLIDDLGGHARFFSKDGYHHHIGSNHWQGANIKDADDTALGLQTVYFYWESIEELTQLKEEMKSQGVHFIEETGKQFKISDPSGIILTMEHKKRT